MSRLPVIQQTPYFQAWFDSLDKFDQAIWLANGGPLKLWNPPQQIEDNRTLKDLVREYLERQP